MLFYSWVASHFIYVPHLFFIGISLLYTAVFVFLLYREVNQPWTYPQNRSRLNNIENRHWLPRGSGDWRGKDWGLGISRCKLLNIGWTDNMVLPYSTGNCIQYPRISHNGKEYVYNWVTLLYSKKNHNTVNQVHVYKKINLKTWWPEKERNIQKLT